MDVLLSTLKEELETVRTLERKYLEKLRQLPSGSFFVREVGSKRYGYLTKRDRGRVVQVYLGSMDDKIIQKYRDLMRQKREAKRKLKSVRNQIKILKRALRGKTA